ncbi:MAG: hypothetical protein COC01_07950, partial [Bacteroidetes bacterium]
EHNIDIRAYIGQIIKVQFRQHTNVWGEGYFTLVDDVKNSAANPADIGGTVFLDMDASCSVNSPDEVGIGSRMVRIKDDLQNNYYVFTDLSGDYSFEAPAGEYEITLVHNDLTEETCGANGDGMEYTVNAVGGQSYRSSHFHAHPSCGLTATCDTYFDPCPVCPHGKSTPCPCEKIRYNITIKNDGSLPLLPGALVTVDLDPNVSFCSFESTTCDLVDNNPTQTGGTVSSSGCGTPCNTGGKNLSGASLQWELQNAMVAGATCEIWIYVQVGNVALGTQLNTTANFDGQCAGFAFEHSDENCDDEVLCERDPNDKSVHPAGCGPNGNITDDERLSYKVRFQNNGNLEAYYIVIHDYIDEDLDIESLKLVGSSHPITKVEILPLNHIVWTFEGINLPYSSADEEGSKGFVKYSLKPKADLPDGTEITNEARIVFGLNEPIITNTVLNTVKDDPMPSAEFVYSNSYGCLNSSATFDFMYSGGSAEVSVEWNFGPNAIPSNSTDLNPEGVMLLADGANDVTLTVTQSGEGCISTSTQIVYVNGVSCGQGNKNDKVLVCYSSVIPEFVYKVRGANVGNDGSVSLCVNRNAVATHVAEGACIGACNSAVAKTATGISNDLSEEGITITARPNPFNEVTHIEYSIAESNPVSIIIYNVFGQEVMRLINNEYKSAGDHEVTLNAMDLPEGIYYYTFKVEGNSTITNKLVLSK